MAASRPYVPLLDSLLSDLVEGRAKKFCAICFRTEAERRMISNKALKQLTEAILLTKTWQFSTICKFCARRSSNALCFLRAAAFAAQLDTVFKELIYQKKMNKTDVFRNDVFKRILAGFETVAKKTPKDWERLMRYNRRLTQFNTTKLPSIECLVKKSNVEGQEPMESLIEAVLAEVSKEAYEVFSAAPIGNEYRAPSPSPVPQNFTDRHLDQLQSHLDRMAKRVAIMQRRVSQASLSNQIGSSTTTGGDQTNAFTNPNQVDKTSASEIGLSQDNELTTPDNVSEDLSGTSEPKAAIKQHRVSRVSRSDQISLTVSQNDQFSTSEMELNQNKELITADNIREDPTGISEPDSSSMDQSTIELLLILEGRSTEVKEKGLDQLEPNKPTENQKEHSCTALQKSPTDQITCGPQSDIADSLNTSELENNQTDQCSAIESINISKEQTRSIKLNKCRTYQPKTSKFRKTPTDQFNTNEPGNGLENLPSTTDPKNSHTDPPEKRKEKEPDYNVFDYYCEDVFNETGIRLSRGDEIGLKDQNSTKGLQKSFNQSTNKENENVFTDQSRNRVEKRKTVQAKTSIFKQKKSDQLRTNALETNRIITDQSKTGRITKKKADQTNTIGLVKSSTDKLKTIMMKNSTSQFRTIGLINSPADLSITSRSDNILKPHTSKLKRKLTDETTSAIKKSPTEPSPEKRKKYVPDIHDYDLDEPEINQPSSKQSIDRAKLSVGDQAGCSGLRLQPVVRMRVPSSESDVSEENRIVAMRPNLNNQVEFSARRRRSSQSNQASFGHGKTTDHNEEDAFENYCEDVSNVNGVNLSQRDQHETNRSEGLQDQSNANKFKNIGTDSSTKKCKKTDKLYLIKKTRIARPSSCIPDNTQIDEPNSENTQTEQLLSSDQVKNRSVTTNDEIENNLNITAQSSNSGIINRKDASRTIEIGKNNTTDEHRICEIKKNNTTVEHITSEIEKNNNTEQPKSSEVKKNKRAEESKTKNKTETTTSIFKKRQSDQPRSKVQKTKKDQPKPSGLKKSPTDQITTSGLEKSPTDEPSLKKQRTDKPAISNSKGYWANQAVLNEILSRPSQFTSGLRFRRKSQPSEPENVRENQPGASGFESNVTDDSSINLIEESQIDLPSRIIPPTRIYPPARDMTSRLSLDNSSDILRINTNNQATTNRPHMSQDRQPSAIGSRLSQDNQPIKRLLSQDSAPCANKRRASIMNETQDRQPIRRLLSQESESSSATTRLGLGHDSQPSAFRRLLSQDIQPCVSERRLNQDNQPIRRQLSQESRSSSATSRLQLSQDNQPSTFRRLLSQDDQPNVSGMPLSQDRQPNANERRLSQDNQPIRRLLSQDSAPCANKRRAVMNDTQDRQPIRRLLSQESETSSASNRLQLSHDNQPRTLRQQMSQDIQPYANRLQLTQNRQPSVSERRLSQDNQPIRRLLSQDIQYSANRLQLSQDRQPSVSVSRPFQDSQATATGSRLSQDNPPSIKKSRYSQDSQASTVRLQLSQDRQPFSIKKQRLSEDSRNSSVLEQNQTDWTIANVEKTIKDKPCTGQLKMDDDDNKQLSSGFEKQEEKPQIKPEHKSLRDRLQFSTDEVFNRRELSLTDLSSSSQFQKIPRIINRSFESGRSVKPRHSSVNQAVISVIQPSRTVDQPSRTSDQPSRTANQPSRTANQPSRTANQPSRTANQPSRTADQPSHIPDQPVVDVNRNVLIEEEEFLSIFL